MKFILALSCALWFLTTSPSSGIAQEAFSGTIVFTPLSDDRPESDVKQGPDEIVLTVNGAKSRWEEFIGPKSRVVITDLESDQQYVLFSLLGESIALVSPEEEMARLKSRTGQEVNEADALPIAGFNCSQATVEGQSVVFTDQYILEHPYLPIVQGMPLEFALKTGNGEIRYRASKVEASQPGDELFLVPQGYLVMNADQMQDLFRQMDNGSTK